MPILQLRDRRRRTPSGRRRRRGSRENTCGTHFLASSNRGRVIIHFQRVSPFFSKVTSTRSGRASKNRNMFTVRHLVTSPLRIKYKTDLMYNRSATRSIQANSGRSTGRGHATTYRSDRPFTEGVSRRRHNAYSHRRGRNHTGVLTARGRRRYGAGPHGRLRVYLV